MEYNGVLAYEFILPYNTYHRSSRSEYPDCYAGNPLLVNGLSDVSKCYFGKILQSKYNLFAGKL